MAVLAKFYVRRIDQIAAESFTIHLSPVTRGEENKMWSKWTPSGNMELTITNPDAVKQFVYGQEYMISFEAVEKPV